MNIGIILPSLEISQLGYEVITQINNEIAGGSLLDYRIFFERLSLECVQPLCATMNISEIWGYSGLLISTTLENTFFSLKLTTDVKRVFYVWDMEWLRGQKNYLYNLSILRNTKIALIARNEETNKELDRYCNRKADLITDKLNFLDLVGKIYAKTNITS